MKLSVIIPSRNGGPLLEKNLPSVAEELSALGSDAEILVADDASDLEIARTAAAAQRVSARLLELQPHRGFSRTCNAAARAARGRYLLFLNNDMRLERGTIAALLDEIEQDEALFAVSPKIVNLRERFVESSTRVIWYHGALEVRFPGREWDPGPRPGETRSIDYPCGGAFLCRAERFLELGRFDERLSPFYWEDASLGLAARARGWWCAEIGSGVALHDHAQTIGAQYDAATIKRIYERNRLIVTWAELRGARAWIVHLSWLLLRLIATTVRGRSLWGSIWEAWRRY